MSNKLLKASHAVGEMEEVSLAFGQSLHPYMRHGEILIQTDVALPESMLLRKESPLAAWDAVANIEETIDGSVKDFGLDPVL